MNSFSRKFSEITTQPVGFYDDEFRDKLHYT